jgi:hypothetical protein
MATEKAKWNRSETSKRVLDVKPLDYQLVFRFSTLRNANRLVVLKEGKLEEIGTHDELIAKKGKFHRVVEMQQEVSKITEVAR